MLKAGLKGCSICGRSFPLDEFSYGQRANRSYCKACNRSEKSAYARGGMEAARQFREAMRSSWHRSDESLNAIKPRSIQ